MKLSNKQTGILIFALITAILHLAAAFDKTLFAEGPDPLFILNGIGFLGFLGAYFLPIPFFQQKHGLVRQGFIIYAVITILAWLVIWVGFSVLRDGMPFFSHDSIYGVPAKLCEVALIVLLRSDK
jgi:hypothetical protein